MTSTLGFRISAFGLAISAFGFRFCDFGFRNLQSAIRNGVGRFRPWMILFVVLSLCVCSVGFGAADFGFGVADLRSYTSDSAIRNPQSAMELNGEKHPVAFKHEPNKLLITIGGEPFATYLYEDSETTRPYFSSTARFCKFLRRG